MSHPPMNAKACIQTLGTPCRGLSLPQPLQHIATYCHVFMSYDFIYFHVVLCDLILLLHLVSLWPFTTHHHAIAQVRKELLAYLYARKACSIQIQSRCIKYTCTILYYPLLVSSSPSVQPIPEPAVTAVRCDLQNESRRRRGAIRQLP